jgi:hypothetical protein
MGKPGYKLSYTAASLSITESVKMAEVYLDCGDWDQARQTISETNLLQSRTNRRTIRVTQELSQRLKFLTKDQLELLVEGSLAEQKYLLWYAVCKTYALIQEFAVEVLHEKFLSRSLTLTELDYEAFYNRKADWHEELDSIKKTTRIKLKTVLFRMLREADLTTSNNMILHSIFTSRLMEVLKPDAPMSFQIFPVEPSDIRG